MPVILGIVILTASTNLPDFDEAVATFENSSVKLSDVGTTLMSEESGSNHSGKAMPVSSGKALGWGSTSEVLP